MTLSLEFFPDGLEAFQHETPFFLFSRKKIIAQFNEFKRYFPGADINYAMKANSEPQILQTLHKVGSNFEIASVGELNLLKKLEVPPERIVFGSSIKSINHIKEVFAYGIDRFACDSFPELEKIAHAAPGSRVYLRVHVNEAGSIFQFSEKFGAEKEDVPAMFARARALGLHPYGVSFHVGSQASDPMAWANALSHLHETIETLNENDFKMDAINIGGGFPCSYASTPNALTLSEIAANIHRQYQKLPYQPKLVLEPGRGIIAKAAVLVTSVIARIERRGKIWLFLDAGVYNALFEAMAYQGSTRYKITSMNSSSSSSEVFFALAGPTGDSPDIITREALLPSDMSVGDKVIFHDVGAYSLAVSSQFNGFPTPSCYVV
jgi:ornithine decarboxylase